MGNQGRLQYDHVGFTHSLKSGKQQAMGNSEVALKEVQDGLVIDLSSVKWFGERSTEA